MNELSRDFISPESLAAKFAAAQNLTNPNFAEALQEDPRIAELLWFLQRISTEPGGLNKFVASTVNDFAPSFGPAWLHDTDATPTLKQRLEAWKLLPDHEKTNFIPRNLWEDANQIERLHLHVYPTPINDDERKKFNALLSGVAVKEIAEKFLDAAKWGIPEIIKTICAETLLWNPPQQHSWDTSRRSWYCKDVLGVLIESMELHAARALQQLARTELVDIVFDHLDYAWSERRVVKIDGQSRTGKTEAIHAWAKAYPGRCRLVTTPCGISTRDLYVAVAEALGIDFGPQTSVYKLKDRVQYIIRHCGLMFIFDEAHYLLPAPSSQAAAPARLDWLRSNVIDRRLGCALVCTPQNWKHAQDRLENRGYNTDQFSGRIDLSVTLPEEPRPDDLDAVVQLHGLGIPKELHQLVVDRVTSNEAYLKSIEAICTRAKYLAKKARRPVCQADVEKAVVEVIPPKASKPKPATRQQEVTPNGAFSSRRKTAPSLESPRREISPALETVNH